jgi:phospholipase C
MMQQMRKGWAVTIAVALVGQAGFPLMAVDRDSGSNDRNTTSPIKHVIVLIGENRTFDHELEDALVPMRR